MLLRGLALGIAVFGLCVSPLAAEPDEPPLGVALGQVVDGCTTASLTDSANCLVLRDRWALLKDLRGETQFLIVARDPGLRLGHYDQPEPALWSAAWAARICVQKIAQELDQREIAPEHIGVVINSRYGAGQDRQHIHVDEIYPARLAELMAALEKHASDGSNAWDITLGGTRYSVVKRPSIDDQQIFADMAHSPLGPSIGITTAVIPVPGDKGVLVLTGKADGRGTGSAENDLQVAHPPLDHRADGLHPEHDRRSHCADFRG